MAGFGKSKAAFQKLQQGTIVICELPFIGEKIILVKSHLARFTRYNIWSPLPISSNHKTQFSLVVVM